MACYSAFKKNEIMPFLATWMNLEIKSDRGRQIAYGIAYMWKLKKNTNELIYKTGTNSQT